MKRLFIVVLSVVLTTVLTVVGFGQCRSMTSQGPGITEDFDTLVNSGNSGTLPTGWLLSESGASADGKYTADDGSTTTGDTYSYGATSSTNRTFGGLRTGSLVPTIGACFTNNTGAILRHFYMAFDGKKWRAGETAGGDKLSFQYSMDATSLTSGTWHTPSGGGLDYTSPSSGSVGAVDGNTVFTHRTGAIGAQYLPIGASIYIRWNDFDVSGNDDGLGIDNFTLSPWSQLSAFVDVGGRVTRQNGTGISGATITLINYDTTILTTLTSPFGYYNFPLSTEAGNYVIVTVSKKTFTFAEPAILVSVFDTVTDADFVSDQ